MQRLFAFDRKVALHNGMRSFLITHIYVYEPDVSQDFSDLWYENKRHITLRSLALMDLQSDNPCVVLAEY